MSSPSQPGGKLAAAIVVVAVPLALGAVLLLVRGGTSAPGSPAAGPGARPELATLEAWPEGGPRILSRDWTEQGLAHEELCFVSQTGEELGCGVRREGEPWEGTFVEWHAAPGTITGPTPLKEIGTWRAGRQHGLWRTFNLDGSPLIEARYEDGRFVSREVLERKGNPLLELGARKKLLPPSRRTRNTGE